MGDKQLLMQMSNKLRHRGPDGQGHFCDKTVGLAVRRLSIIDPLKGKQPMFNEKGDIKIAYNGELFNFFQIKNRLTKLGYKFNTNCDTEAVLYAYEEYGKDCLNELNGQFAFVVWDGKKLFLARDFLGIMPLYYCFSNNKESLLFASEIKALLVYEDNIRQTRDVSLAQYFKKGGWTPFVKIRHLLPGHFIEAEIVKGKLKTRKSRYYKMPDAIKEKNEAKAVKTVRTLAESGIKNQLISDVPLGVLLSGGLDSSIVSAVASKSIPNLKTFSIGTEYENEFYPARAVAEIIDSDYQEVVLSEKMVCKTLPQIIYHLENYNPRIVQTSIPNFQVVKFANRHVKVLLCGEGSDELFCGFQKWFFPAYYNAKNTKDGLKRLQCEVIKHTNTLFQQNLLRVDRISMAHSVESRVPLLDQALFNYSMQLNPCLKIKNRTEKYILRKAFKGTLPKEILWKRKQYFSIGAGVPDLLKSLFGLSEPEEKHDFYKKIFEQVFVDKKAPCAIRI